MQQVCKVSAIYTLIVHNTCSYTILYIMLWHRTSDMTVMLLGQTFYDYDLQHKPTNTLWCIKAKLY